MSKLLGDSFMKLTSKFSLQNTLLVPRILPSPSGRSATKQDFVLDPASIRNYPGTNDVTKCKTYHSGPDDCAHGASVRRDEIISQIRDNFRKTISFPYNFHSRRYRHSVSRGVAARNSQDHTPRHMATARNETDMACSNPERQRVIEQKERCRKSLSDITERGRSRKREDRDHASWFRSDAPSPRPGNRRCARGKYIAENY